MYCLQSREPAWIQVFVWFMHPSRPCDPSGAQSSASFVYLPAADTCGAERRGRRGAGEGERVGGVTEEGGRMLVLVGGGGHGISDVLVPGFSPTTQTQQWLRGRSVHNKRKKEEPEEEGEEGGGVGGPSAASHRAPSSPLLSSAPLHHVCLRLADTRRRTLRWVMEAAAVLLM